MSDEGTKGAGLGATVGDFVFALVITLCAWAAASWADRALATPPEPELEAVGIVADPHHMHMGAIYGSFAREAAEGGGLRVHNHQTSEPHGPTLARPWDFVVGKLAGGGDALDFFWTERFLGQLLFPLGCMLLLGECLRGRWWRWGALFGLAGGGSLYWIGVLAGEGLFQESLATWLADIGGLSGLGFAYPAVLVGVPHLALEIAFFAGGLGAAARARRTGGVGWAIVAGVALFFLAAVRPYTAPAALAGSGLMLAWGLPPRGFRLLAMATLPAVPLLVHYALVLRGDSVFAALDVVHPAPPFLEQLLFCGAPVLLLVLFFVPAFSARRVARGGMPRATAVGLHAAFIVILLTVEGPFVDWQVEAFLPVPLFVLLAAVVALRGLPVSILRWLAPAILVLHFVPTVFYAAEVRDKLADPRSGYWLWADERAALSFLEESRPPDAAHADTPPIVLLTEPTFGRVVPWLAGVRVYVGHADHTAAFAKKEPRARSFFRLGVGAKELHAAGVTHVLFSPRVKAGGVEPRSMEELELVFEQGVASVYRVRALD